jgi:acetoin utilization deacetylase AcuC-like enzyme
MFRIRRIYDNTLAVDRDAITQVQEILRRQFSGLKDSDISSLARKLADPFRYRLRTILFVAENSRLHVKGFALLDHAPDLHFCYLDYISVEPSTTGGIGGALYTRAREEARHLRASGIFMECLPDDPALCADQQILKQNRARLRFYERFGALPISGTAYETPLHEGDDCPPYLVFDGLGVTKHLARDYARHVVQAILTRKYGDRCSRDYIDLVVNSFAEDPVRLGPPRHLHPSSRQPGKGAIHIDQRIALVVNEGHDIHHIHERGYVEAPVRISSILKGILPTGLFDTVAAHHFPEKHIKEVHEPAFVEYLKRMCLTMEPGKSVYPYVFPIRNATRPPKEMPVRAGYYCIDTFTPLNRNAYKAAKGAVDCALTAAERFLRGYRISYALVRPPGHHAERRVFGGFCYFNSAAIAAQYLSRHGKVAILDVDYHHGNGTQDIFYERSDVLTVSIHGHPSFAYPYFSGFSEERGEGAGHGCNRNYPLPEFLDGPSYHRTLERALKRISEFRPKSLVIALGLDTARKDPTGTWSLTPADLHQNGTLIGSLRLPTLVVQEGGYRSRSLGINLGFAVCKYMNHRKPLLLVVMRCIARFGVCLQIQAVFSACMSCFGTFIFNDFNMFLASVVTSLRISTRYFKSKNSVICSVSKFRWIWCHDMPQVISAIRSISKASTQILT